MELDQKALKAFVKRRHPEYKDNAEHWEFLESCYRGGRSWFDKNIFQYMKEGEKEFAQRKQRAYRFNHTREVVDLVNKYIFKAVPSRNDLDAPQAVRDFWKHATRNGRDIDETMRGISKLGSIYGRPWVVVDRLGAEGVRTRADEKGAGALTYAYTVEPQSVLDMSFDEHGELNWVLIHEVARDDEDPLASSGELIDRYRLWTREEWFLFETEKEGGDLIVKMIDDDEHGLGEVPVIPADHIESTDIYTAPSLINDIAYLDRAVANYLSNLDAIIQDQTFSQLAMPAQNVLPGSDAHDAMIRMGTNRIFLYDGEGGGQPFFLSPDPKQAELIITAIKQIINEIYHTVGMAGERTKQDNAIGIDNSSGVAKAFDFERVNALLTSKASALERIENRIVRLVCLWNGEEPPEERLVKYPTTFDVRSLGDEFEIAQELSLVQAPILIRREQMKMVREKLFPRISRQMREKMDDEIDAWNEPGSEAEIPRSGAPTEVEPRHGEAADGLPSQGRPSE